MQSTVKVKLLLESAEKAAGRTAFDIAERNGLVLPRDPSEEQFRGPNGMPLRPKSSVLAVLIANFRAARPTIFEVPQGTRIPAGLVLLQVSDQYFVEPAAKMTPDELNKALTGFLSQDGVVRMNSKKEFYERHPDMHPTEVGFSKNA
jgi:hypothetical protein